jgi:hypothetical protein
MEKGTKEEGHDDDHSDPDRDLDDPAAVLMDVSGQA